MLGALYATTLFFSIINATVIQPVVFAERAVSYRERAAGTYSVLPWVMALVSTTATLHKPLFAAEHSPSAGISQQHSRGLHIVLARHWPTRFSRAACTLDPNTSH